VTSDATPLPIVTKPGESEPTVVDSGDQPSSAYRPRWTTDALAWPGIAGSGWRSAPRESVSPTRRRTVRQVGACAGCPLMSGCSYGETYEADPPAGIHLAPAGKTQARPVVVAPSFPAPMVGRIGDPNFRDCNLLRSSRYRACRGILGRSACWWGGPHAGLGEDRVLFDILSAGGDAPIMKVEEVTLSLDPAGMPGFLPWVRIALTSPLILNASMDGGKKRLIERPTFSDLIRAGLRALGPLFKCYGTELPDGVFRQVKEMRNAFHTRK